MAAYGERIYKQTGGVGPFVAITAAGIRNWNGMCCAPDNSIYASFYGSGGGICKSAPGTDNFVSLNQSATGGFNGMAAAPNGDIWMGAYNNYPYKQTGGTGNFVAVTEWGVGYWFGFTVLPNGDVYGTKTNIGIYRQIGGTGAVSLVSSAAIFWGGITSTRNSDIYACFYVTSGTIYKQPGGTDGFSNLNLAPMGYSSIVAAGDDLYMGIDGGEIYKSIGGL
jgi:hypothetical protein